MEKTCDNCLYANRSMTDLPCAACLEHSVSVFWVSNKVTPEIPDNIVLGED